MRFLLVAVVLLLATPCFAQSDTERAQAAFEAAKKAYDAGQIQLSITRLREAYRYYPDPSIRVSIARRLVDVNDPEGALAELDKIVKPRGKLRRLLKKERKRVEALLEAPVEVTVSTDPPGALVKIADAPAEKAPITRTFQRGVIKVSALVRGYKPMAEDVRVKGLEPMKVTLTLEREVAFLRIELLGVDPDQSEDEGVPFVKLGDEMVGPGARLDVTPGVHVVSCGYTAGAPATTIRVKVPAGRDAIVRCSLPAPLISPDAWKEPAGWSALGGGAAALAAGVGILISYSLDTSEYDHDRFAVESSKPLAGGITAGLGAGLVGLGTWFLLSR